jgi:succinate dehydrogenase / fumarate reductase cytochrome b subunit
MLAIYVIAMIATCWHFAYGIWLFAAKWGITPGDNARKKFGYVCAAVGTGLCVMGLWGMYAFVSPKYQNAPTDVMPEQPTGISLSAPTIATPGATNPQQPGEVQ